MKDLRIVYQYQKVAINETFIFFDGKGDKESKTLKVYKLYGNVTYFHEALQSFAIQENYDKVVII